jgi:hypothetical protein
MHRQVHHTDVVPELAGRRGMSLVSRSKRERISQLYASRQSHVVETQSPRAMVGEWSRQSPSTGRRASDEVPEPWSESDRGSPRAQVEERATKSPSRGRRVIEAVPEHRSKSGRGSPRAQVEERATKSPSRGRRVIEAVPEHRSRSTCSCILIFLFSLPSPI